MVTMFNMDSLAELIAGLQDDHKFVCDELAGGDYSQETNSGEAIKCIRHLEGIVLEQGRELIRLNKVEDELDRVQRELDEAHSKISAFEHDASEAERERDEAQAVQVEQEDTLRELLLRLRMRDLEGMELLLRPYGNAPRYATIADCQKQYDMVMGRVN